MQDSVTRLLLDERENLRELVRARDAEELEQRHLRRAQPRSVARHPPQRDGLVLRGAGRDRVGDEGDVVAAGEEVADGLVDADVRLDAGHENLLLAQPAQLGLKLPRAVRREARLLDRRIAERLFERAADARDRSAEALHVLLRQQRRHVEHMAPAYEPLDVRLDLGGAIDDRHQLLLHVDDEEERFVALQAGHGERLKNISTVATCATVLPTRSPSGVANALSDVSRKWIMPFLSTPTMYWIPAYVALHAGHV